MQVRKFVPRLPNHSLGAGLFILLLRKLFRLVEQILNVQVMPLGVLSLLIGGHRELLRAIVGICHLQLDPAAKILLIIALGGRLGES